MEILIGLVIFVVVMFIIGLAAEPTTNVPLSPPEPTATDRQLNYIDNLIAERETEDWMLLEDPQTIDEASELIDMLLTLPYREHEDR